MTGKNIQEIDDKCGEILYILGDAKEHFSNERQYNKCRQIDKYVDNVIHIINTIKTLQFEEM